MVNECNVLYMGDKGLMTFDKKKIVFQHREKVKDVVEGLGVIVEGSLVDKGNYAFAVFENVETVVPDGYYTLSFFNNRGVPMKVLKGIYGNNVLLKEIYKDNTTIRAYNKQGDILLYENKIKKSKDYEGPNMYYSRIDEMVVDWVDITQYFEVTILNDLKSKEATLMLSNEKVQQALKGLSRNKIVRLKTGLIVADGKFESLVIWDEDHEVKMAWLGRKLDLEGLENLDITEELAALI